MIQFTDFKGNPIYIAKTWVEAIYTPQPNIYGFGVRAVVACSSGPYGVTETVEEALAKRNAA